MARSVHTRPRRIRAESRVRAPFAPRGSEDARRARAARRALGAQGLLPVAELARSERLERLPGIVVHPPRPGHQHAAGAVEIAEVLVLLGATFWYGLHRIELRRGAELTLGRFVAPGRIELFDVPVPPWKLQAVDAPSESRLMRAGAELRRDGRDALIVAWPGDTLRAFVLRDVLVHELGHHVVHHRAGKRDVASARTCDHEAAAELVAERARRVLEEAVR